MSNQSHTRALDEGHINFFDTAGFFSAYYIDQMKEVLTSDIPSLATDGRHVFINPEYYSGLKVGERSFAHIHETMHAMLHHPQRLKYYKREGNIRGLPFDINFANMCMDYVINASIIEAYGAQVQFNPEWLYNPEVKGDDLWEEIYERLWPQRESKPTTFKDAGRSLRGAKGDEFAKANSGRFDRVEEPPLFPDGSEDLPSEEDFREAVARANEVQKSQGDAPNCVKRLIKEILEPEVSWKDKIRISVTGKAGYRGEDWSRPNRRRLVLSPVVILPGKKRFGANTIVFARDTSGSMNSKEEAAGLAELDAIFNDVRPKEIIVLCCDTRVGDVSYVRTLNDLDEVKDKGVGGGGTDFRPVFDWIKENEVVPEMLVYCTDSYGTFPQQKPPYSVVWLLTTKDTTAPFGEVINIDLDHK